MKFWTNFFLFALTVAEIRPGDVKLISKKLQNIKRRKEPLNYNFLQNKKKFSVIFSFATIFIFVI